MVKQVQGRWFNFWEEVICDVIVYAKFVTRIMVFVNIVSFGLI